jgi:hypothetical protein
MMITDDLWLNRILRYPPIPEDKRGKGSVRHPVTPAKNWQRCYAKVRYVRPTERGAKKSAIRSHTSYLQHKDRAHEDDRLVCTLGDFGIIKEWEKIQEHCRVIIAPQRGDVLDMEKLAEETCREIFGELRFAGAVHEKRQSNGRLNKHIHLVFKEVIGNGASTLKRLFWDAARREATLQFEDRGLHFIPDNIDASFKSSTKQIVKEMWVGDHELVR